MRKQYLYIFLFLTVACHSSPERKEKKVSPSNSDNKSVEYFRTVGEIPVPEGFKRVNNESNSFAEFLQSLLLKKNKTVYLYNGQMKPNQRAQYAVLDIPVGNKDVQQCADAVMRLRAEYLFKQKIYDSIAFMDYSHKWYKCPPGASRQIFENYLQNVFGWCGSASLEKQLKPVNNFNDIAAGDVLVKGGFPGHAMMVVDIAMNKQGQKVFMLAQGYQPAQDIHVLINPMNEELSPWYEIPHAEDVITPEWHFKKKNLRNWK